MTDLKQLTKAQIKALLKSKNDELARVGHLKFDETETVARAHVQTLRNEVSDLNDELDRREIKPDDGEWTVTPMSSHFGGMCWPRPNTHNVQLSWKMRYEPDTLTKEETLWGASIIDAYFALIGKTNDQRNFVSNKIKHIESEMEKAKVSDADQAEKHPTLGEMNENQATI